MSTENKQKEENVLEKIDTTQLAFELSQLVMEMIRGSVETEEFTVKVKIPKRISNTIKSLAETTGMDLSNIYSQMATKGITDSLNQIMLKGTQAHQGVKEEVPPQKKQSQETTTDPLAALNSMGLDTSDFSAKFQQVKELVNNINEMSKVLQNVTGTDTSNSQDTSQDKSQPIVPTRESSKE